MTQPYRKIKVALLGTFPPTKGGISTNLQNLTGSSLKEKYRFLQFQTMSKNQGSMQYFNEVFWMKPFRVAFELLRFIFFIHSHSPRVIHINSSFGPWSFWRDSAYLLLCKFLKKKVLMQYHGGKLDVFTRTASRIQINIIKKIVFLPDQIGVCSEAQKMPFRELGIENRVHVLRNMVHLNPHLQDKSNRRHWSIPSDYFVILFVSAQFFREKGIIETLDAIPLVRKRHPKTAFIMVGGGSGDPNLLDRIQSMEQRNEIVLTGHLDFPQLQKLFAASDCFILPSYAEGLPLTLLEAMASGLPVIATPVGGIPEVVQEGINGYLIPIGNSIALSDKIKRFIQNPLMVKRMKENNLTKINDQYRVDVVIRQYNALYKDLTQY